VIDVGGSAAELRDMLRSAEAAGLSTRPSGPALTYLHAAGAGDRLPAGRRRAGTLEDVFVALTGGYVE
jgi:lipooligosaccharide transport system ATP-binding protein